MSNNSIKFIDLFCGIGGFHQGFQNSGFECVFASDIDTYCQDTYITNYGLKPHGDITEITTDKIPDHNIITAGFPCQPFSICGDKRGFDDTRGTVFFDICRVAQEKNSEAIVLENVKHLIHHNKGRTFKKIVDTLKEMGYSVSYSLLNAKNFGVPQNRERLIIVASKIGEFDFSTLNKQPHKTTIIRDFLDLNNQDFDYLDKDSYTIIDNPTTQKKSGLIFVGYRNKNIRKKGIKPNTEHLSRVHKQPNRIYSIDGTHPTLPSQEISGRFYIYIPETKQVRKLSLRECYRIMGFPDSFIIYNIKSQAYKQIGNSVCVPMVESIAKEIKKQLYIK